jgi:hypothetical protein
MLEKDTMEAQEAPKAAIFTMWNSLIDLLKIGSFIVDDDIVIGV